MYVSNINGILPLLEELDSTRTKEAILCRLNEMLTNLKEVFSYDTCIASKDCSLLCIKSFPIGANPFPGAAKHNIVCPFCTTMLAGPTRDTP
jgi:hypothetical protein